MRLLVRILPRLILTLKESGFVMPEDVKLVHQSSLFASDYVRPFPDNDKHVQLRGSIFDNGELHFGWPSNSWSTADARVIANYILALSDEIDNPPREWVEGATYTTNHLEFPLLWKREVGGWRQVKDRSFVTDEDVAWNTKWLDSLELKPRVWETGALYASMSAPTRPYRRESNGWRCLDIDGMFFTDGNWAVSEDWLSALVKLVPEIGTGGSGPIGWDAESK